MLRLKEEGAYYIFNLLPTITSFSSFRERSFENEDKINAPLESRIDEAFIEKKNH